jgi:hypothetical protein
VSNNCIPGQHLSIGQKGDAFTSARDCATTAGLLQRPRLPPRDPRADQPLRGMPRARTGASPTATKRTPSLTAKAKEKKNSSVRSASSSTASCSTTRSTLSAHSTNLRRTATRSAARTSGGHRRWARWGLVPRALPRGGLPGRREAPRAARRAAAQARLAPVSSRPLSTARRILPYMAGRCSSREATLSSTRVGRRHDPGANDLGAAQLLAYRRLKRGATTPNPHPRIPLQESASNYGSANRPASHQAKTLRRPLSRPKRATGGAQSAAG